MPFRKLFSLIGDKFKKLSGIDDVDKHIGGIIDGKLPNLPAAAPATGKPGAPLNPTSLMLIATVGFAAVGSFLALMVKTLSDMGLKKIALAVLILGLILLVPAMIFAAIKLHRRDYGRFLEGSGWVINMPMLLTLRVSGAFSRRPPLPKGAKKDYSDVMNQFNSSVNKEKEPINWPAMIFYIIVILTVLGVGGYYFYNSYYLPKHKKAPTECMESSAETQQPTVEEVAPELEAPVPDVVIPATKIEQ